MEFFGLTYYGASDPIKFYMRPDFEEPKDAPDIRKVLESGKLIRPIYEVLRQLDMYNGILDGYAYRSVDRLKYTRKKGFYKPIGPSDMYKAPLATSMDYGWFLFDPELQNENWFKAESYHPQQISERSRFLNNVLLKVRNFML